jgi:hypothetical protein
MLGRGPWVPPQLSGELDLEQALVAVERVFGLVAGFVDRVLRLAGCLVDLPFALEILVVGQVACGLLDAALGFIWVSQFVSSS